MTEYGEQEIGIEPDPGQIDLAKAHDPFDIRACVPDFASIVASYAEASAATCRTLESRLDVSYGAHPDEKLDLFFPSAMREWARTGRSPIHLFVHGGYWHKYSKATYSFVANTIVEHGAIAAIVDFSRLPKSRMEVLVGQVRRAADWLYSQAQSLGADSGQISASGHSAGAHLASYLVCRGPRDTNNWTSPVRSVLLVSGLFDLDPVAKSFLQPELSLTAEEIADWSPYSACPIPDSKVRLAVGQKETSPFFQSTSSFARHLDAAHCEVHTASIEAEDHMSIVRSLEDPQSSCGQLVRQTIAAANGNGA